MVDTLAPQREVDPKVLALAVERHQCGVVPRTSEIAQEEKSLAKSSR